jgi:hypothetical protein
VKKYWYIGGVVLLAFVLVGGTLLIDHKRGPWTPAWAVSVTGGAAEEPAAPAQGDAGLPLVTPQADQVQLETIETPPAHTLAFIDTKQYSADSAYSVTFVPYGLGARPHTLVIQVVASRPGEGVDLPYDFVGSNAVVDTSRLPANMAITKGGTYAGTLMLVKQASDLAAGGVLAPVLLDAALASSPR